MILLSICQHSQYDARWNRRQLFFNRFLKSLPPTCGSSNLIYRDGSDYRTRSSLTSFSSLIFTRTKKKNIPEITAQNCKKSLKCHLLSFNTNANPVFVVYNGLDKTLVFRFIVDLNKSINSCYSVVSTLRNLRWGMWLPPKKLLIESLTRTFLIFLLGFS